MQSLREAMCCLSWTQQSTSHFFLYRFRDLREHDVYLEYAWEQSVVLLQVDTAYTRAVWL